MLKGHSLFISSVIINVLISTKFVLQKRTRRKVQ